MNTLYIIRYLFYCTFFLLFFVIISYLIFSAIMMINDRPTEHHHCPRMAGSPLHHHRKMSTLELQRAVENASNLHQTSIIIDIMTSWLKHIKAINIIDNYMHFAALTNLLSDLQRHTDRCLRARPRSVTGRPATYPTWIQMIKTNHLERMMIILSISIFGSRSSSENPKQFSGNISGNTPTIFQQTYLYPPWNLPCVAWPKGPAPRPSTRRHLTWGSDGTRRHLMGCFNISYDRIWLYIYINDSWLYIYSVLTLHYTLTCD